MDGIVNAKSDRIIEDMRTVFDGDFPTVVLDATGNQQSMKSTFSFAAFGGKFVFLGLYRDDFTFFDPLFHKKEITLMASKNSLGQDFEEIISPVEKGILDSGHWVNLTVSFQDLAEKFDSIRDPKKGVTKAMAELK